MPTNRLSFLKPSRLDLYLLQEVIGTFFGASVFIIFVLLMFQTLRLAEFFIVHGASAAILMKMTFFLAISFLPMALPLSFLMAILIAFSRMSADSEIIAMKAHGISLARQAAPILLFSLVISALSILLNLQWVPWSALAFKQTQIKLGNTKVVTALKEGTFTSGFFDLLFFADKIDTQTNRLQRVFIYDEREPKNPLTYVSREAEIFPLKDPKNSSPSIVLRLYHGSMHHHDLETNTYERIDFQTYNLYLKIQEGNDSASLSPYMIPQEDLLKKIKENPLSTHTGKELRGEYWRRYATALSPLLFVFLGIGLGTFQNRNAKTGAVLKGLIILLTYWVLQTYGTSVLLKGILPPFVGAQLPNLAMLIGGIFSFRRAAW